MLSFDDIDSLYPLGSLLESIGAKKLKDKGEYFHFSSPLREDKNPSMVMYKKNLYCIDFSGHFKGSLFKLYKEVTGESLLDFVGMNQKDIANSFYSNKKDLKNSIRMETVTNQDVSYFHVLNGGIDYNIFKYRDTYSYLKKRFISKEFSDFFQIGYSKNCMLIRSPRETASADDWKRSTLFENRLCIPIYFQGELLSMEGRTLKDEKPKVIYPKGGSVSNLFNYDHLKKNEPLIVVEGIMDIPRIWDHITKNVTTTFGIQMTYRQREQLQEFQDVILFPDTDEAGRKMVDIFDDFYEGPYRVAFLPFGDPGDPNISINQLEKTIFGALGDTEYYIEQSKLFEDEQDFEKIFWESL